MVAPKDATCNFDKEDYYEHPENYIPVFHENVAPYASVIVNCMYWEKKYPRLLSTHQFQELMKKGCPLVGISDITCDIGGSIEFVNRTTYIDKPFFRYDPFTDSYHDDMEGDGVICLAVDILPTEFSKEASQHFGDILSQFVGCMASTKNINELPPHLKASCLAHKGELTPMYTYINRIRKSSSRSADICLTNGASSGKKCNTLVSLSGHLFDQHLINEALDIIEAAGGSFSVVKCEVGQNADAMSYSELEVGADDNTTLSQIIDSLTSVANASNKIDLVKSDKALSLKVEKINEIIADAGDHLKRRPAVLILGAGHVCRPAVEFLSSIGNVSSSDFLKVCQSTGHEEIKQFQVIVASLYKKDADKVIEGIPYATAIALDAKDHGSLSKYISEVEIVLSLLPPSFHAGIASACIEHKKHLVTASYIDASLSELDELAKSAGVTILGEMGLDPGIDHMMAMKMINQAHARKGKIVSFTSYCGGLPSPVAANNPLAYKFSWNPAGAIRAGRNSAIYKSHGSIVEVDGKELYDSAVSYRIPDLPAFALEYLPNRNSLLYGDLYRISKEASTIFRATLRYQGFCEVMSCLAKIGFFDYEIHPMLKEGKRPTFRAFLCKLLEDRSSTSKTTAMDESETSIIYDKEMIRRVSLLGCCKEISTAKKTVETIKFLGLNKDAIIPETCSSAFDVMCLRMEERLSYTSQEQDMVILHHEVEVEYPGERPNENHRATLLEFGRIENEKTTTAMALTVGIPAAIGVLLLAQNKVQTRGIIRPLEPEVYMPALDILEAVGIKLTEKVDTL